MKTFKKFISEARSGSSNTVLALASDNDGTDELRKIVNAQLKIRVKIPKISARTPASFVSKYNKLLSQNKSDFKKIFDLVPTGVGPGEVLLSYLSNAITIGGGSSNYDVQMGNNKIEVKATKIDTNGYAYNFRLGVDSRPALSAAIKDLKDLYNSAKYHISEIDNEETLAKIDRGEMTSLKKHLKLFNPSVATDWEKLPLSIFKNKEIYFNGEKIGSLTERNILKKINELVLTGTKKIKSFDIIEKELSDKLSSHAMQYFFFNIDTKELYYSPEFPTSVIDTITGGSVKVKTLVI
jgi:hypothetical protein